MYSNLLSQYELLNDDEKNTLLIYKSKLSYFINNINRIDDEKYLDEFRNKYLEYKDIVMHPINNLIRMTVYKDIDFSNLVNFIRSIRNISEKLDKVKGKIKLVDDITLYRAKSVNSESEISKISKGNLISTSYDLSVTDKFYGYNSIYVLYQIKAKKDMPCLVIPYSIKVEYINDTPVLKKVNEDSQKEIVLYKDSMDYEITSIKNVDNINIVSIETNVKKKINF